MQRSHRKFTKLVHRALTQQAGQHFFEMLEGRRYLAAHIVGSTVSYSTIQAAVNAAVAGATITVDAGSYAELVTVNKQLTIRGAEAGVDARSSTRTANKSESTITGASGSGGVSEAFYITANDVTIDGFTVQGETSQSDAAGAGIVIAPTVAGTHILNNMIQNNVAGIFLANSSSTDPAVIQDNVFNTNNNTGVNGGRGIYTDGSLTNGNLTNVIIDSNNFTGNRGAGDTTGLESAVAFEAANAGEQSNITVTNNTFTNNGKSVLFFNTTNVLLEGNTATGALDWYSGSFRFEGNNHNVTIEYNSIINNPGPGIAVDSSGVAGDSSGFVINYNNIYGNGTNSYYSKAPPGVVYNENEYDGTFDARYNYWGTTTGPAGDGPGTGNGVYGNAYKANAWIVAKGGPELYSPFTTTAYSITEPALPGEDSKLTATVASSSQINLSWVDGSSASSNQIQRSTDALNWSTITTVGGTATSYSDTGLSFGTTYYYRIIAVDAVGSAGSSNIASATTTTSTLPATYLSDMNWVSATAGYGTVQKDKSISGNTLTLGSTTYSKGIGTHASSTIVYNLAGDFSTFQSAVGIDAEEDGKGTGHVEFIVLGDGKTLFDSGVLINDQIDRINVSVAGVKTLTLEAVNGVSGSIDYDHSDWAGAAVYGTVVVPTAPANLVASALSAASIQLSWTQGSSNVTSYSIDRSTNGTTFTTVATGVSGAATTWTDPTALSSNTKYYYRIRAVDSVGSSPNSNIASTTTLPLETVTYLSDLTAVSSTVGYGTIQKDKSILGNTLTLAGKTYSKGIGTHAASSITYNLAGKYSTFISDVGIDAEEDGKGSGYVDFQVIGDGVVLYDSGVLTNDQVGHINVSVAGVQNLVLVATNGVTNDIDYDHADWAGAELYA